MVLCTELAAVADDVLKPCYHILLYIFFKDIELSCEYDLIILLSPDNKPYKTDNFLFFSLESKLDQVEH